jgi:hypothetical protein
LDYAVRWESNLTTSVTVQLLQEGALRGDLATVPASNKAFTWRVADSLAVGSGYRIRIISVAGPALRDSSSLPFIIALPTSVDAQRSPVPAGWDLAQNYPNPFNPVTQISYAVPTEQHVMVSVHTLLGQQVAVLVNGPSAPGRFTVSFDASGLPSGMYIYRLSGRGVTLARKLIIAK